jgi:hypothetical protein
MDQVAFTLRTVLVAPVPARFHSRGDPTSDFSNLSEKAVRDSTDVNRLVGSHRDPVQRRYVGRPVMLALHSTLP